MSAIIESLRNGGSSIVGASRDDLQVGDVVTLDSVDVATTYGWTMAYKPEGSTATFSGSVLAKSPGSFTVDKEGPYLIRLTVDYGLATESTQYVRLRYLTELGSLGLVAAGENNDGSTPWPIPVDNTPDGWADQQNFNLLTLLGLIKQCVTAGRVTYVDADPTVGDHDTIQAGIDYSIAQGASLATPWIVAVRPGTYAEDVLFKPFAHVIAWPGSFPDRFVTRVTGTTGHTTSLAGVGESVILRGLTLTASDPLSTVLTKSGNGEIWVDQCYLQQLSATGTEGPAFDLQAGSASIYESYLLGATGGALTDRFAFKQSAGNSNLYRTQFIGASGCEFTGTAQAILRDSQVTASGPAGALGISSVATSIILDYCRVVASGGDAFQVNPTGAGAAAGVAATLRWTFIGGEIYFDTNGIVGPTNLFVGSCEYTGFNFPTATPTNLEATTNSTSLFYDNTTTGITAENVQDAIDEVHALAIAVQTLDDAYDGGVGGGVGRTILADAGAVQIVDAAPPSDPPDVNNPNGRLQVVGGVEVGSIGKPEVLLDPNPYGNGPFIEMGQAVWPGNAPFGGTAFVVARSTGNPLYRNYGLRIGSLSADGGGDVGRVLVRGGDAIQSGTTPNAAVVVIQAGSSADPAVGPGDVVLLPGSTPGVDGSLILASMNGATGASVTAGGVFVGGVTGVIRFGTDMGAIEVSINAADNLAAVQGKFNATGQVTAVGDPITLTTVIGSPTAEIYFLNDDQGGALDVALGQFDGQPMVQGNVTNIMPLQATGFGELTIGGFLPNPLVFNANTGKLTVPGLIDPTGMNFTEEDETVLPNETIFVSDGTGIPAGHLGYKDAVGVVADLSAGGGGGEDLAVTLGIGNFTGGTPIQADVLGNLRGPNALDLQVARAAPGQVASGPGSFVQGAYNTAYGIYSMARGLGCSAIGPASHATGVYAQASGQVAHAEGSNTVAAGDASHAEGKYTNAGAKQAHAEGYYTQASSVYSHAEGWMTVAANAAAHAEGFYTKVIGSGGHAEGYGVFNPAYAGSMFPNTASGVGAHAEGSYTEASGNYAHAEGRGHYIAYANPGNQRNVASGHASHVEGRRNVASGNYSHAEGYHNFASGHHSHAEGGGWSPSYASGYASHVEGAYNSATNWYDHAEGYGNVASGGNGAHAEGLFTVASGQSGHAEGRDTTASGSTSHAEGRGTVAGGTFSHAEGFFAKAYGSQSHAENRGYVGAGAIGSHAEGNGYVAGGALYAHAEGYGYVGPNANYAHAEGGSSGGRTKVYAPYGHVEGMRTFVYTNGPYGHAEGWSCYVGSPFFGGGIAGHAEGHYAFCNGDYAHAEGWQSNAYGKASHCEGRASWANNEYSHAEGWQTNASNVAAHAEGRSTQANGYYSHAEGYQSAANGFADHTEGWGSTTYTSLGSNHSEGYFCSCNTAKASHAQGAFSRCQSASYAHAGGKRAQASTRGQMTHSAGGEIATTGWTVLYGEAQWSNFSALLQTIDATANQVLFPTIIVSNKHAYHFRVMVVAVNQATWNSSCWTIEGLVKNPAGVASMVPAGTVAGILVAQDVAMAGTSVRANVDGANGLTVEVTGLAATTIRWHARVMTSEVGDF